VRFAWRWFLGGRLLVRWLEVGLRADLDRTGAVRLAIAWARLRGVAVRSLRNELAVRRRRERVGAHELESRCTTERDALQAVVDGKLRRARWQDEILDPAAEAQIEHAQPVARTH